MKRLCKWGLILGCVVLGAWTLWNLWATSKLEKVVADLSARGLATTLAELEAGLPPFADEPDAEQNAAPILEAAFALIKSIEPLTDWEPRDGPVPDDVRDGLPRFGEVFDLLYQAAERTRCRFERDWSDGFAMLMPHLSELRDVAMLLRARAIVRSADGEVDEAIEDVRVIFSVARSLREEPILISQLVRIAVAEMGLEALQEILPRSSGAVAALERTSPDAAAGSMARAFQGELALILSSATDARAWDALADAGGSFDSAFSGVAWPYIKSDVAFMARLVGRCVEMAGKPYPVALSLVDSISEEVAENGGMMTKMFLPSITKVFWSEARHASRVALAGLAARCIDYKREHGKYPAGLGDLKDVEPDPLTGRPFVLETRAEGILLRSQAHEDRASEEIEWELGE